MIVGLPWLVACAAGMSALGASAFAIAVCLWYPAWASFSVKIDPARDQASAWVLGFYPPEHSPDGRTFVWTGDTVTLALPGLDRSAGWTVTFTISRASHPGVDPVTLTFAVDDVVATRVEAPTGFADVLLNVLPKGDGANGTTVRLRVSSTFIPGPHDPRSLGIVVDSVSVTPDGKTRWLWPPAQSLRAALLTGAWIGFAVGMVQAPMCTIPALALMACFYGTLMVRMPAPWVLYPERMTGWACGVAVAVLVWRFVKRSRRTEPPPLADAALLVSLFFLFATLLLVLHPLMITGDAVFHVNRLKRVLAGNYYFTSVAPGGDFPYPIALYVVASALTWITLDWAALLRAIVAVAHAGAGFVLFWGLARVWPSPAALLALVLYHLVPAAFQVQGTAYLTNGFGQAVSVMALACVLLAITAVRPSLALVALVLSSAVAFMSHFSSFVLLLATLLATSFFFRVRGSESTRLAVPKILFSVVLALGLSVAIYHGHFGDFYQSRLTKAWSAGGEASQPVPPVQWRPRAEAHQARWAPGWNPLAARTAAVGGYAFKYFGTAQLLFGGIGVVLLWRRAMRDPVSLMLVAWIGVCGLFLVVGVLTPFDVRYYLWGAPAIAALAGHAVFSAWNRGTWGRASAVSAMVWAVIVGVGYWMPWISSVPPR